MTAIGWEDLLGPDEPAPGCGTTLGYAPTFPATPAAASRLSPAAADRVLNELVADSLRYRRSAEFAKLVLFLRRFQRYRPFKGSSSTSKSQAAATSRRPAAGGASTGA